MNLTFTDARVQCDGGVWLCIKVNEPAPARAFVMEKQNRLYDCDIKQHREKRSLDANAYYWKLCGELAKAIHERPEEIYRRHIKDFGNYAVYCMEDRAVRPFEKLWTSGHLGRFIETRASKLPGCTTVLAYYGSSDFSRAEMSALIDNCVQDCKAIGIETLTPDRLSAIKEDWDAPSD